MPLPRGISRGVERGVLLSGVGLYRANGVNFDGTNDYLTRGADLTGNADSGLWTGNFWFKRGTTGTLQRVFHTRTADPDGVFIEFTAGNLLRIVGTNVGKTVILDINSSAVTDTASWHHCVFSVDLADVAKRHLYIDDASDLSVTTYTNDIIDFTGTDHAVGAKDTGSNKFDGDLADVWLAHGVYIDLSVVANRRKFISDTLKPVFLGADGSVPTGTAPIMFFSGPTDTWHTNDGTGGGFTENGALTDATSSPSD